MIGAALSSSSALLKSSRITSKWTKCDLPQDDKFSWNYSEKVVSGLDYSPATLIELLLSDDVVESIASSSVEYARQKGNHSFQLTTDDLRLFFAILFTSGYCVLPYRRMHWECSPDVLSEAISKAVFRNRLEEILRFIHLANNNAFDSSDKFAKVRPLINFLNDSFLQHFPITQQLFVDESMMPYLVITVQNSLFAESLFVSATRSGVWLHHKNT